MANRGFIRLQDSSHKKLTASQNPSLELAQ
jgi:hypothetical protein